MKRRRLSSPPPTMDHAEQRTSESTIQDQIIPKLYPYITLCDIESLSEATGVKYSYEFGLNIEECCLRKHPVACSQAIYKEYGTKTTILTLQEINEADAREILKYFTAVQELTLHNMLILESIDDFPEHLSRLTIVECEIKESLMNTWIGQSKESLTHLHLHNLVHTYHPDCFGVRLSLRNFMRLISVRLNGPKWDLTLIGHKIKFLHLTASDSIKGSVKCPNLIQLHFDVPSLELALFGYAKSLMRLTMRNWIDPHYLRELRFLKYLEILSAVPTWKKPEVEELHIPEVKVHFEPPCTDPDLIFEMLNEYCLLEIINYLRARDWIPFATLHPRVECAVNSYKYPRAELDMDDLPLNLFKDIAPLVRNIRTSKRSNDQCGYIKEFISLKSLTISRTNPFPDWTNELPVGIERLSIDCRMTKIYDLTSPYKPLSPTLRVVETNIFLYEDYMFDLKNLREIKLEWIRSIESVAKILKQNLETLERVELSLKGLDCTSVLKLMQEMPKLKVIGINWLSFARDDNQDQDILKEIGPKLKKLSVTVDQEMMLDVLRSGFFNHLQELEVGFFKADHHQIVSVLGSIKTLWKLRLYFIDSKSYLSVPDDLNLKDSSLVELLIALPQLTEVIVPAFETISFGHEPRKFLKQQKRTLRIREYSTNSFVGVP